MADERQTSVAYESRITPQSPAATSAPITAKPVPSPSSPRLASIDAYRGLVMFLMMAEVLSLSRVSAALPDSAFWRFLAHHQTHVEWIGCSLHDLIQPSFSFLVGVALPFSLASRVARGQSRARMTLHAFWRVQIVSALEFYVGDRFRDINQLIN